MNGAPTRMTVALFGDASTRITGQTQLRSAARQATSDASTRITGRAQLPAAWLAA